MGCCSNKEGCNRPREEMVDAATLNTLVEEGAWVLTKLMEIARGGARFVGFKNATTNELAATISAIVTENNYLKSLLGVYYPGKAAVEDRGVTVSFGPRNSYTLFIPTLTQTGRTKLADSLIAAAEELKKSQPAPPDQKWLPFSDCA